VFVVGYFRFIQGVVDCFSLSFRDILCVRCFPVEPSITSRSTNKNSLSVPRNTVRCTISIFEFRISRGNFRIRIACLKKKTNLPSRNTNKLTAHMNPKVVKYYYLIRAYQDDCKFNKYVILNANA